MPKPQEPLSIRDSEELNQLTKDSELKFQEMLVNDNDSQLKQDWPFKVGTIGHFNPNEIEELTKKLKGEV